MTQPAPNPHESNGIEYGHVFAQFTEGTADTSLDLDPYPDERPVTGSVSFRPKFSGQAAVATLRVPGTPRSRGLVVTEVEYKIVNSRLVDLQDREGVWLIFRVGDIPVHWQATVVLRDRSNRVVLQTAYLLGDESWVAELDGTRTVNLPDLIPNPSLLSPSEVAAILSAQSSMDRALVVAGELEEAMPEISAAGQYASDAQDAATLAGREADRAAGLAGAQDAVVADHVATEGRQTQTAVDGRIAHWQDTVGNASYASANQSLLPPILASASLETTVGDPKFIDFWGGYMWGFTPNNGDIYRSNNDGATWTLYCNSFNGPQKTILRIIPTADGEVLVLCPHGLFKSSGWANGNAATWSASKVSSTGVGGVFNAFNLDGDGQKFILVEYAAPEVNWADSRYGYISTDAGTTWVQKWDSNTHAGLSSPGASHIHAACYDPFSDRFYVAEGHGAGGGVYTSTDDGATWTRYPGMQPPSYLQGVTGALNNGPTVIVATNDGLVMGSDNYPENGLFGVAREVDPSREVIKHTWAFKTGRNALHTFAQRGWRDPDTGQVYVTFRAEYADTPIVIAAGTAHTGGLVYSHPLPSLAGSDRFIAVAKTGPNRLVAFSETGPTFTPGLLRGTLTRPGGPAPSLVDTGNSMGGVAGRLNASASGAGSRATAERATANGIMASATGFEATADGFEASATGTGALALGKGSTVSHPDAVGVGRDTNPKQASEVDFGPRHLTIRTRTLPIVPDADTASLALVKDAQGQNQLVLQFATGGRQFLGMQNGFRVVTTNTTLTMTDHVIISQGANITITLPSAIGRTGFRTTVKHVADGVLTVASLAGSIDGAATVELAKWGFATFMSNGSAWYRIA